MDIFFGRDKEKKILEKNFNSDKAEFIAIYGRRRVGKTYLITEFFKNKGVYFEITGSKKASLSEQIRNFCREFNSFFGNEETKTSIKDWGDAFYLLKDAISKIPSDQKVILFFDELPWLASPKSGFLRALDYFWNRHASRMKNVKLIVCGSAAAWMIRKVIRDKGGLHNRLSAQIRLEPFSLSEVEELLRSEGVHFDRKQLITLYMSIGGIPKYLNFVEPGKSVSQILNEVCFNPNGYLFQEFHKLYESLFDKSENHIRVIRTLSDKRYGLLHTDLIRESGLTLGGGSTRILEELEECGFIMSFPELGKIKRERHWRLIDEYSLFYLNWVEGMRSAILRGSDPEYWIKQQKTGKWQAWAGYSFENICLKHVFQIKKSLGLGGISTVEAQWSYRGKEKEMGAQIDLVIDRADNCINLCEIKFSNDIYVLKKQDKEDLERKVKVFRNQTKTKKTLFTTMITPYGVRENEYYIGTVQQQLTMDDLFIK
ncbi:ATP-binding protein [Chlamydiales bacterium]|nr:ATP-binding protein [Chlamydiales bacterium]